MPPEIALGFGAEFGAERRGLGEAGVDVVASLDGGQATYSSSERDGG